MPYYSYRDPVHDVLFEKQFPMGNAPQWVLFRTNGIPRMACRDIAADHQPPSTRKRIRLEKVWPRISVASGVAVNQIKDAHEASVRAGVPTDFTKNGDAIIKSRSHQTAYLHSIGMHDNSGAYNS